MDVVRIVTVDPLADDGLLERWVEVGIETARHEFGDRHARHSAAEVRARQRVATDQLIVLLAAVAGDELVAEATLELPLLDNPHFAGFSLSVRPTWRRRGIGGLLLSSLESLALSHGRSTVSFDSAVAVGRVDPAAGFAAARGYEPALVDLRNDLDLPASGLDALLAPLEADAAARAGGYHVLTWWDDVPEQWLDQRAHLMSRMSTDTPMGELRWQEERWDADRMREHLQVFQQQGRRRVESVALERSTGRLVAFTELVVAPHTPDVAYQWNTLVSREHRGRRLGQLVKAANLRALLAELPDVRRIVTWNSQVNEPMLRVNRAMGFRAVGVQTQWQKILA